MYKLLTVALLTAALVPSLVSADSDGHHHSGTSMTSSTHSGMSHSGMKHDDHVKALHIAIDRLTPADRATLITKIETYIRSKGITLTGTTSTGMTQGSASSTGMAMTDQLKALHGAMGKLSAADHAGLITMIKEYLTSKGIVISVMNEQNKLKQDIKEIRKRSSEEMKEMRKKTLAEMKKKREEMRAKVKELQAQRKATFKEFTITK